MFDIGFPELLLVSVVALVVIGPEKLPSTIRTLSLWLGRLRHSLMTLRDEIEAEIGAEDLKRQLQDDELLRDVKETRDQLDEIISSAKKDMNEIKSSVPSHNVIAKPRGSKITAKDAEKKLSEEGETRPGAGQDSVPDRPADAGRDP